MALSRRFTVLGLSRRPRAARPLSGVSAWRSADLVSRSEAEEALKGARFAVFLVHSLGPSAGLPAAGFADLDLLAADNFARAAASAGVEQIVFLSGLSGAGRHQASRLEVERALGAHGVPVTTVRSGLIVGRGGSSFEITNRLVDRLPFMLLPAWTRTATQPVALADVVRELADLVGRRECYRKAFDVGGAEIMSFRTMLERTAAVKGRTLRAWDVPFAAPRLSTFWVSLITGAPQALVAPLVESLGAPTLATRQRLQDAAKRSRSTFDDAVAAALLPRSRRRERAGFPGTEPSEHFDVRALQRVSLPPGADAGWLAARLTEWLSRQRWPLVTVTCEGRSSIRVVLDRGAVELLRFERVAREDDAARVVFRLAGGLLWRKGLRSARLEIRAFPGEGVALVGLHDFAPRLPWALYRAVQVLLDQGVMRAFARASHSRRDVGQVPEADPLEQIDAAQ